MPHAGLMNERELGPVAGLLQRARLHIRGGRRRLRQGKTAAGIATLYDALNAAMEWCVTRTGIRERIPLAEKIVPASDRELYSALVSCGILDGTFDFDAFDRLTDQALDDKLDGYDARELLHDFERVMTQLGVMPFDEASLPPEDPGTF